MIYNFTNLDQFENDVRLCSNIYLAAAGCYGQITGKYLNYRNINWQGYLDNNALIQGKRVNGKKIFSPNEIQERKACVIIICTIMRAEEIEEQLCLLGYLKENIFLIKKRNMWELMAGTMSEPQKYLERWNKLRGIGQKYQRCFVIGTGPSITISDLNMLRGEFTFSTNAILNCFDKGEWRPTCYCVDDPAAKERYIDKYGIENLVQECEYVICSMRSGMLQFADRYDNLLFYRSLDEYREDGSPLFSEDVLSNVYCGGTTLYGTLQAACWMGFKEIYLLGVDLGFAIEKHLNGTIERKGKETAIAAILKGSNDVHPIYEMEKILQGYCVVKKYAQEHGIKIQNATRGGKLEIFERVNLDTLF